MSSFQMSRELGCCKSAEEKGDSFDLDRDLDWAYTAKGLRARNGELHVPEIGFRRDEFHTDVLLSVASPVNRDHSALERLRGVVVHKNQALPYQYNLFQRKQRTVTVHRLRMGLHTELFTGVGLAMHGQGNG